MSENIENKPGQATPESELYRQLMDPNIAKTELGWFAKRRIEQLEALNTKVKALEIEVGFLRKSNEQLDSAHREEIFRLNDKCVSMRKAQAERIEKLEEWVNDLQSGMYINCVYCGHRYGPKKNTPVAMAEVLKQHIEKCSQHPMSKLKIENKVQAKRIKELETLCRKLAEACKETKVQIEFSHKTETGYGHWTPIHNFIEVVLSEVLNEKRRTTTG